MNVKRFLLPAAFLVGCISLCGLAGCSKSGSTNNSSSNGTMGFAINGSNATASFTFGGYIQSYGQIIVQGDVVQNKDTAYFQVYFPYNLPIHDTISTDSLFNGIGCGLTYVPQKGKEYDADYGFVPSHALIVLTSTDSVHHTVAGSFSGVLYNTVNSSDSVIVSGGNFLSDYTVQ